MNDRWPSFWLGAFIAGVGMLATSPLLKAQTAAAADAPPPPPPELQDDDHSPYHEALLQYKSSHYAQAEAAIDAADAAKPGNPPILMLKSRILTEQHKFEEATKVLEGLNGNPAMTPAYEQARTLALGDLSLRERHFDAAAKFYESLLVATPNDPDLLLKAIYARVSVSDLVTAAKDASLLKPLDPDHPSYYFAKASIAQANGQQAEVDQNIETVRTIYGITVTNRYLKTFLQVFSNEKSPVADRLNPPSGATNAVPTKPY